MFQQNKESIMTNLELNSDVSITMNSMIAAKVLTEEEINKIFKAVTQRLKKQKFGKENIKEITTKIKNPILDIKRNMFGNKTM